MLGLIQLKGLPLVPLSSPAISKWLRPRDMSEIARVLQFGDRYSQFSEKLIYVVKNLNNACLKISLTSMFSITYQRSFFPPINEYLCGQASPFELESPPSYIDVTIG